MRARIVSLATIGLLTWIAAEAGAGESGAATQPAEGPARLLAYRLTIDSNLILQTEDGAQPIRSHTEMDYGLRRRGETIELLLYRSAVRLTAGGQEAQNVEVSGRGLREKRNGQWVETSIDRLGDRVRRRLMQTYGVPLCRIRVDEHGAELKRTVVAKPGAQAMIRNGLIENTRLFHAPYYPDRPSWTAPVTLTMGEGQFAEGRLRYRPQPAAPDQAARQVKVIGKLTHSRPAPGESTIRLAYDLSGRQTYSPALGDWVGGRHEYEFVCHAVKGDQTRLVGSGTIVITLEPLAGQTPTSAPE